MQTNQERILLTVEATEAPRGEIDFRIAATRLVMQMDLGGYNAALLALERLEKDTSECGRVIEFFGDRELESAVNQSIARCHGLGKTGLAWELEAKFGKYVKIR